MAPQSQTQRSLLPSFLVSIALSGAIGIFGCFSLLAGQAGRLELKFIISVAIFAGCSSLVMNSAIAWQRRLWRPIPSLTMVLVAMTFVWSLLFTWAWEVFDFLPWAEPEKPLAVLWVTSLAFYLFNSLSLARLRTQWQWVRWVTVACISVLAAMLISIILFEPQDDIWGHIAGALGIGATCGVIAVPILHRLSGIPLCQPGRTAPVETPIQPPPVVGDSSPATGTRWWCWGCALIGAVVLAALSIYTDRNFQTRNTTISFDYPSPPLTLDCGNGVTMDLVRILPGTFTMGSNERERDKPSQLISDVCVENPPHEVTIGQAFYLGKYEVTQAQWRAVMGNNPSYFKGYDLPVEQVSWKDCQAFCRKLSEKTGKMVRLPTEEEWEYACRAGSRGRFCFGDNDHDLGAYAWYEDNSGSLFGLVRKTHPVGQKQPNAWGLYDLHGNVCEWCDDVGQEDYPESPTDGSASQAGSVIRLHIFRGGSWNDYAFNCRSADRSYFRIGLRQGSLGFRLAVGT